MRKNSPSTREIYRKSIQFHPLVITLFYLLRTFWRQTPSPTTSPAANCFAIKGMTPFMDLDSTRLGAFLTALRGEQNRNTLSKRSSLTYSHIQRVEDGEVSDLRISTIIRFADAYETHPLDVFTSATDINDVELINWATSRLDSYIPKSDNVVQIEAKLDPQVQESIKALTESVQQSLVSRTAINSLLTNLRTIAELLSTTEVSQALANNARLEAENTSLKLKLSLQVHSASIEDTKESLNTEFLAAQAAKNKRKQTKTGQRQLQPSSEKPDANQD